MYYILKRIDDKNKIIYIQPINDLANNDVMNDYYRIIQYASENNYTIELYEKKENYEDVFSLKKRL